MDDFNVSSLHESKNEWGSRLLTILTPLITEGLRSIFDEAVVLCKSNNEMDKYLMTFQNFISRIPKWNPTIVETEKKRIVERSGCGYLEDLVTCVHIIQLKLLTAIRVGQKQKKIDIHIPKLDDFIHKIYIHVARKVYKNVYLFELGIPPLHMQKNHRELEIIVQECILNTIRESIPVESILQAYMDETEEENVVEEIKEQIIDEKEKNKELQKGVKEVSSETTIMTGGSIEHESNPKPKQLESDSEWMTTQNTLKNTTTASDDNYEFPELPEENTKISFDDLVSMKDFENNTEKRGPTIFEKSSSSSKSYYDSDDDEDEPLKKLNIHESVSLDTMDVHDIDPPSVHLNDNFLLEDVEILA
jgi:Family of unknown function (DUF5764)